MTYTIKPLGWVNTVLAGGKNPYYLWANAPLELGGYEIRYKPEFGWWNVDYSIQNNWGSLPRSEWEFLPHCHTLEAAKQAAQDHWEERLKEALTETTDAE